MVPIKRSQKAFAIGACTGDFNTAIPHLSISSSKPAEKVKQLGTRLNATLDTLSPKGCAN
jgi:hypothetical protein